MKKILKQLCFDYGFEELEYLKVLTNLTILELDKEEEQITLEGKYTIQAVQVLHGETKPAYGYCINNQLGLTGDAAIGKGVETIVRNSRLLIADSSLITGDQCHMGADNIQKLLQDNPDKKIIGTHMRDKTREFFKKEKINNFIIPEDGDIFEI